jgi:hypothetical protein
MQTTQGTMLQSLRSVKGFLDTNAAQLAGVVQTGARQRLDDAISALEGHASDQTGSVLTSKGLTQKQKVLRTALLRDHMTSISRIAKADLPATPEFLPLRMPRGKPTPERLAAAATGMAQVAAPFADVFIKAGMPQDFIAELSAAADDMVGSVSARTQTRGKGRGATTGLKAKLSEGRKIVHILDAFVKSALKDDPTLLSNWNVVKRVPKPTGRAASPVPTPTPTPTPTGA